MQERILEGIGRGRRTELGLLYGDGLQFRRLLEKLPVGAYACDPEGHITCYNRQAVQLWGRAPRLNDPVDRYCGSYGLYAPDGSPIAHDRCWMALALRTGREYSEREIVIERPDGRRLTVLANATPIHDEFGRLVGAVNVLVDVSDCKKRAEEELVVRALQQATVAKLGQAAITKSDLQTLMHEAVGSVARTLGVEYCKVLELLPDGRELLLRAGVGWEEELVGRATVGAGLDSQAGYTLASDGPVVVEDLRTERRFSGPPLLREHGVVSGMSVVIHGHERPYGVLGAHTGRRRDFTEDDVNFLRSVANVLAAAIERERAEEALLGVKDDERRRMARDLHDDVLQDIAYALQELRTKQSKLRGDASLNGAGLGKEIEALQRSVLGLRSAIYDLRLDGDHERTFGELLECLVRLNRQLAPHLDVELSVEEGSIPPLSRARVAELLRILREALANVRRHSGAGRVRVAVGASGGRLWAEFSDDGRGFDPTKRPVGTGTKGMRERARALGGNLKVGSEPGKGTTVRFEAPVDAAPGRDEAASEELRILLVDDHASIRQALASAFEGEPGFVVAGQAGSLAEARGMLEGVDLAIVDLGLPDGYGGDLIRELRAANPRAMALVLSANLDREEAARAVERGAAGILHKSAAFEEVVDAVRRLKAGEPLLTLAEVVELLRFASSRRELEYEARQTVARLTAREKEVLQALADGLRS
jgi:PAS domain S-box-containing protein